MTQVQHLTVATENFTDPLTRFDFLRFLKNSVFVTIIATLLTLIVNALAAFALSKYRFRGDKVLLVVIISTLMIPLTVIMVPAYLSSSELVWLITFGASSFQRSHRRPACSCCVSIC